MDLTFGGPGNGKGKFDVLRDFCFDAQDNIYVLDGLSTENQERELQGNALVQVFDNNGKFQREFSIMDATLGESNMPMQIAISSSGNVFISQFKSGEVLMYSKDGELAQRVAVPNAYALSSGLRAKKDWVVIAARQGRIRDEVQEGGTDEIILVDGASGEVVSRIKLSVSVVACEDIAVDSKSNFYLLSGESAEVFKFSPSGELVSTLGSGVRTRDEDGSVLLHSIAVDSKDNFYAMTHGNPGFTVVFDPEFQTVRRRAGGFKWADPWSIHSGFVPIALDGNDRLWLGAPGKSPNERYHTRPVIIRSEPGFLDSGKRDVFEASTTGIGLKTSVSSPLLYDISYEPGTPVTFDFTVAPARRRINNVQMEYQIVDSCKNRISGGKIDIPLVDGNAAKREITFTPSQFGWYAILCTISSDGEILQQIAQNIGVTPRFENMITLKEGEAVGGWVDPARQSFTGLRMMRLATGADKNAHDALEKQVALAKQYPDIHAYGIFTNVEDIKPENVRAVMERFKGRITHWEIINEPNLGHVGPPEKYIEEFLKPATAIIKEIDPSAKVVGPNTCGIDLNWNRKFLELGGGKLVDVFSIHDYEGNESLDPGHWRWKYGELKKLLAEFGLKDMPIWQTERGWLGVRQESFSPVSQAVRLMLHMDLLETFGIPSENSHIYYLNNGGFGGYPAFFWSQNGPHIGALATRMRESQVKGKKYAGELDFGPTGNKIFMGIHFTGSDEDVYIVRNLGFAGQNVSFVLKGKDTATVMDWAGNVLKDKPSNGALALTVTQMPTYIRVAKGGTLTPDKIDFGKNIAADAKFTINGDDSVKNLDSLNNGIFEVTHAGNPHRETLVCIKDLPIELPPQTVEIKFANPREVDKIMLFSMRADNPWSTVLDFDVESMDASGKWITVKEVRSPIPVSEYAASPYAKVYSWMDDTNAFVVPFDKPVEASQFRLVIRRVSAGLVADDPVAIAAANWGSKWLCLREIEIYQPVK